MRFAYLIVAHGSFRLLEELIQALDSSENDIFVHIDKKCGDVNLHIKTQYSKLFLIKRTTIEWGGVSMIKATLNLLRESVKGNYDYYHLLSGVDFPIKSNKHIAEFFEKNKGKEFVGFCDVDKQLMENRLAYYHLIKGNKVRNSYRMYNLNEKLIRIQKKLNIKHIRDVSCFRKGCNWFSITNQLAQDLVKNSSKLLKIYKYTNCADEIFLQTYIYQNSLMDKLYNVEDEYMGCVRKIDWQRGIPYVWQLNDYEELINAPASYLYARKFSEEDLELVRKIANFIR